MSDLSGYRELILAELSQDQAQDDVTAKLLGPRFSDNCQAQVVAKQGGVFFGEVLLTTFSSIYKNLNIEHCAKDGATFEVGDQVVSLTGRFGECLGLERTLLNMLSHLCGVASLARQFADKGAPAKVLATRKTLPGLRRPQLDAIQAGGAYVHRRSLSDGILIKENHQSKVSIEELLKTAHSQKSPLHKIEIEVQSLEDLDRTLKSPFLPDIVMLDNMALEQIREAKQRIDGKFEIEVSGGVNLDTIGGIAAIGVDYISVGALTHSVTNIDLSMDFG